jgi:tRNA-(ms[2]io[6]A)-hydroxylase
MPLRTHKALQTWRTLRTILPFRQRKVADRQPITREGNMRVLKTSRDEAWLSVALGDPLALLADHAHCEKKAAASAMALIARHPDEPELVSAMIALAKEELEHFAEVHDVLIARGGRLGPDKGDPYVQELLGLLNNTGSPGARLIERLLASALIEARSFERLRLLGDHHPDPELREIYERFAKAEARHGATFVRFAREAADRHGISRELVDARLEEHTRLEAEIIERGELRCAVH